MSDEIMSYKQAMKWGRKHPKGTKQPVLMSTGSGFWPSGSWLKDVWWPYVERCKLQNREPIEQERFYLEGDPG